MKDSKVQSASDVLLFSELYLPWVGGSVQWVRKIGEHWPGRARVLCGLTPGGSAQPTRFDGLVPVERLWLRMDDWGPDSVRTAWQYANAAWRLARTCAGPRRPDLVICGRGVPEGFIAHLAGKISGVPYATLVHGEEVVACGTSGQLAPMLRLAYGHAACAICNSANSKDLACQAGARGEDVIVSHPGAEVRDFAALLAHRPRGVGWPVTLITVGRFDERKNHAAVLRTLARLRGEGLDIRYIIAGYGPLQGQLAGLAARLGLGEAVTWVVNASDERIQQAYLQADIFVMPAIETSADIEGFGIVYIEAALAAMPSVAGAAGGCKEAVLDGLTGLIVDGRDDEALAGAVRTLALDAKKRRRLGLAARKRAVEHFDWPVLIRDLAGRVRAVIDKRKTTDKTS